MADDTSKQSKPYMRRLTSEERREGFLLVEKRRLGLFPSKGDRFKVKVGREFFETALEAIPCQCRGPDKPHAHYHIPLPKLKNMSKGSSVTLTQVGMLEYELSLS